MERIVIAVGGNSLLLPGMTQTVQNQRAAVWETAFHIAAAVSAGYGIIVSHGNGPQVGQVMRRSELASHEVPETTLDYAVAETQGGIGYQLQQALTEELSKRGIKKNVITVVTQVEVSSSDKGFKNPTKPIGSFMDEKTAKERALTLGWNVVEDSGRGWRRVVASPWPQSIIEKDTIKDLVDSGIVVIACGGGGIPVVKGPEGLSGIEAVIDKDRASAVLALEVKASKLLVSTAVPKVCLNYGKPNQVQLDKLTLDEAKKYSEEGHFAKGSMGPKIEASIHFLENGGQQAVITDPAHITLALKGDAGTIVSR
ncbi:MAG TPA: carbamate kinase [Caldisericia bacterium]|nr:MAG: Carbamate kinase 1 [bacterium ADurb.Bin132]HNW32186.1 carbamate kinase [Caldisericia bacterium]HNY61301.1 carbamate kinase [Caldisericia bacterium]HOC78766.1 carbamate kinase [Caldisericia bacterium]HOG70284.1 carbamate kinase [Caldisericia bacterium]